MHVSGYDLLVEESANSINSNSSILLSRNDPIAVVVGAAGFLGSSLTDKLLSLGIQVIGIDNLSTSRKENLTQGFKAKNFHFLHLSIEDEQVEDNLKNLPHLDYAIFIAENPTTSSLYKSGLHNFLKIAQKFKRGEDNSKTERPKVVFVSSIQIYDNSPEGNLNYLKSAENQFAKFIKSHGLNGRVVRLAEVYGPRMHFRENESVSRLIKASLEGKLNKEETALDFSSRSLFIEDAVALILKSILSGSTSGKIYDGCLLAPVKVEEIKQVLINPEWHISQNFLHTPVPPWPTPNLDKSVKELAWKPKSHIAKSLKTTIDFFENDQEAKDFALNQKKDIEQQKIKGWTFAEMEDQKEEKSKHHHHKSKHSFLSFLFLIIFLLGVLYPLISFILGAYALPSSLNNSRQSLEKGDVPAAKRSLEYARISNVQMNNIYAFLQALTNSGLIGESKSFKNLLTAQNEGIEGVSQSLEAVEQSSKSILQGEQFKNDDSFSVAQAHLSNAVTILSDEGLRNSWFIPNKSQLLDLTNYQYFYDLSQKGRELSSILPLILGGNQKTYLLLIGDSSILQPQGGKLTKVGELKLQKGTISISQLKPVAELDLQLTQKNIQLSQSNINTKAQFASLTSADFPQFAQNAKAFYQSLNGGNLDGVIFLDQGVVDGLNSLSGATADLSELLTKALNGQNLFKSAQIFDQALVSKQLLIFSGDSRLESILTNLNWAGTVKSPTKTEGLADFLAVLENNHSQVSNKEVTRKFLLQSSIEQDGGVKHTLTIAYTNKNPQTYESNLQILLPLGSKVLSAKVGEAGVQFSGIVDFGRAVYSGEISINPGTTPVVLEYTLPTKLEVGEQGGSYNLKINKQPGSGDEEFNWQINYPFSWDLISKVKGVDTTKHQINIQATLDADKVFDLTFKKP